MHCSNELFLHSLKFCNNYFWLYIASCFMLKTNLLFEGFYKKIPHPCTDKTYPWSFYKCTDWIYLPPFGQNQDLLSMSSKYVFILIKLLRLPGQYERGWWCTRWHVVGNLWFRIFFKLFLSAFTSVLASEMKSNILPFFFLQ